MTAVTIRGLDHLVLRVADLQRSLAFYCGVLGCREERRLPEFGLVQLRAGNSLIDLVPVESVLGKPLGAGPGASGRNLDHFALQIAPFDAAAIRTHLERNGIEVGDVNQRYGAEGTGPSIYIKDPDGNTVELKGPAIPGTRLSS